MLVQKAVLKRRQENRQAAEALLERLRGLRPVSSSAVRVRDTGTIKGGGLYACCGLDANEYLFDYPGEILDEAQYQARYPAGMPSADYVVCVGSSYIDAVAPQSGQGRYMNHSREPNCMCWTMEATAESPPRAMLFTMSDIEAGEELVWNYGKDYWRDRPAGAELLT